MVEELSYQGLALVAISGVVATFINVIAGGGGMIVIPALIALGLPVDIANGTYRLGVITQSLSGTVALRGQRRVERRSLVPILIPTVSGAALGAFAATSIPRELLKPIVLVTMILMAALIVLRKETLVAPEGPPLAIRDAPRAYIGLFLSGVYGGFIQAGTGFLLLAVLVGVLRYDFVGANLIKLLIVLAFGTIAFGIFVWAGQVAWTPAIVLAVASILGARLGVKVMLKVPAAGLRWFVFVCVVATCIAAWLR